MLYKLSSQTQENFFLNQPETGMGYQIIEARPENQYSKQKYIILNSQIAIDYDSNSSTNVKKVIAEGINHIKLSAHVINFSTNSIKVYSEKEYRNIINEVPVGNVKGAIDNPKEKANGIEKFVRLSAFHDDKRIDRINNCLRAGSFTTTENDYNNCKNYKNDPIQRYALPNEEKIEWAFLIVPEKFDNLQRGKVQPANGKQGGGDEVYFETGTTKDTFKGEFKYLYVFKNITSF
jgi:hypothetical protein